MHLRSPAPTSIPTPASSSSCICCQVKCCDVEQFPGKRQQLEKAIVTVNSFNVNYKNKQQLQHRLQLQFRPSQSSIFGFGFFLCTTPSNYARFPTVAFVKGKYFIFYIRFLFLFFFYSIFCFDAATWHINYELLNR